VRGVDLHAALEGGGVSPAQAAVGEIGGGGAAGGGAAGGRPRAQQLPTWPGAAPGLVDAFQFQDLPRAAVDGLLAALAPLEAAAADLGAVLGAAAGGGNAAAAAAPPGAGVADVAALREAAAEYSTLLWAYDKVGARRGRPARGGSCRAVLALSRPALRPCCELLRARLAPGPPTSPAACPPPPPRPPRS
jgi:hypothetical protein